MVCNASHKIKDVANSGFEKTIRGLLGALAITTALSMSSAPLAAETATVEASLENIEGDLGVFIEIMQERLNVLPGVSVSIVLGDQVLLTKGFGLADIATQTPFTASTYSYIASGTKAFVGLAVATLVERGELDLDAPVGVTYLGDMDQEELGLIADVNFRQLLTHTHGLNGEPLEFRTAYTGGFTSEAIWQMLRGVEAAESGADFNYSNFGYVAAGYILEHIYGETWQNIVDRTVLAPTGMDETVFYVSSLVGQPVAQPHQWMGTTSRIPLYKSDRTMHAAGGQYTTAHDMATWLQLNINAGRIEGAQVIPASAIELTHAPLATLEADFYDFKRETYGLGWYDSNYEGERLLHHFGAFSGYRAHISMMPSINLGVAVLSNDLSPPTMNLPDMIAAYVYDMALGKEGAAEKFDTQIGILAERIAPYAGRTMPTRPRNAPENETEFAGLYENKLWGVWDIRQDGEFLRFHWGQSSSDVIYVERDGTTFMRFEVAGNGYLARPIRNEDGTLLGLSFRGNVFSKRVS
jgi:CubicO group peptidase (beta-lactamase class C family)